VAIAESERTTGARRLFAPLAATYDRYASLLSFGQDPRWRRYLVSRVEARPGDVVLDVATGTAAVAIELARAYGCRVVGVDQSPEMLAEGRRRVTAAGLTDLVSLEHGRAEEIEAAGRYDALTFTYLLRYVDEPAETLARLVRAVRPGGTVAMLEFGVPGGLARPLWEGYVRAGLPAAGALAGPEWAEVGRFLGPSIRGFWAAFPLEEHLQLWRDAGVGDVRCRRLSLGGGIVVWGHRGD
jgi:demethylmenaquinone methyltransferase/2-methoxy-6-polyprenyl-1,4-benzoquinol methylase